MFALPATSKFPTELAPRRKQIDKSGGLDKDLSTRRSWRGFGRAEQVVPQPRIPVPGRPEIEWQGRDVVDDGDGETVLGQIDGLDVPAAAVARLHARVLEGVRGVDGQRFKLLFPARWTRDAQKFPLGQALRARQHPFRAVPRLTKHAGHWKAAATGTP